MAFWEGDAIVTYIYPSSSLPSTDLVHVTLPFDLWSARQEPASPLSLILTRFLLLSPSPGARWPAGIILYPIPLTNIVIMSPIHFISHCPLGQHICAFMHRGHDYHCMSPLHLLFALLFAEAGRGHHLGTELMAGGNPLSKRILWTLCHWMTPIWKSSL